MSPLKNGFTAAHNFFRMKYARDKIFFKSTNWFNFWKVEKSLIRRLRTIYHRLRKALFSYAEERMTMPTQTASGYGVGINPARNAPATIADTHLF
jgi:hypothetical protein